MSKSEELQATIERLQKEIMEEPAFNMGSPVVVAQKQCRIFVAASQLAEISSKRLEKQTDTLILLARRLNWLTVALVFLGLLELGKFIVSLCQ